MHDDKGIKNKALYPHAIFKVIPPHPEEISFAYMSPEDGLQHYRFTKIGQFDPYKPTRWKLAISKSSGIDWQGDLDCK